ncbi:MAG: tRNA (adenosine(37)-N6)-threonylcarbamoyltransferase complex dimerization subunit type 1 TsaB [Crocinitomicaceae bacterium]|nr:tRNA (adenosine(37)-N6)-threonylcarbamoyltransferase complex dimerization subunit type 1 TsaB [Crocinitomicaceae bacterium]MCF8433155.1 tRNA (adenosine(37)-N6)-threonylcarbamoyltransferase complex dimerization subunit type 1 TsaB [Crocinitomicaceae bacterium]
MTLILHLETSTKACSVALSRDGKLIALKESLSDEFSHSENLTVFIQTVVKDAGIELKDLSAISVASGPGSYTGLRIGVSTAKGLCYSLNKPLIAIDSLISLAVLAKEKHLSTNLCAMIDARRKEVYCAIYSSDLALIKPITADILDEQSYKEFEPFVYFGDGAEKMQEDWQGRNCVADIELHASAKGQIALAFEKFQALQFEDVAYFEPYYLKNFVTK